MIKKNMYELLMVEQQKQELQRVLACNERTSKFGLRLTPDDVEMLLICRRDSLKQQRRVEFGQGILPKLIEAFCESQYLLQEDYADVLVRLQEIFYHYKNESEDLLTDDELITFMREQFEGVCFGSLEYLEDTCLERFARAIRAGYKGFLENEGMGEYEKFSEEERWNRTLFLEALEELLT